MPLTTSRNPAQNVQSIAIDTSMGSIATPQCTAAHNQIQAARAAQAGLHKSLLHLIACDTDMSFQKGTKAFRCREVLAAQQSGTRDTNRKTKTFFLSTLLTSFVPHTITCPINLLFDYR